MSRISNERIKVLTLNESQRYPKGQPKESQRMRKHENAEKLSNSYKSFLR